MTELTVYSTPTCSPCKQVKKYMERNDIPFTYKDITTDAQAYEEFNAMGFQRTPVISNGSDSFVGFNPMRIKALAGGME